MSTTRAAVLVVAVAVVACERAPEREDIAAAPPVAPRSPAAPKPPPGPGVSARAEVVPHDMVEERPAPDPEPPPPAPPRAPRPRTVDSAPLPEPPSMVPKEYAEWLAKQSRSDKRRIAAFCAKHRRDVTTTCGGIGPLHIPYAPMVRVWVKRPGDGRPESLFSSYDAWHASLTPAQEKYIDRECQGGEDRPSSDLCGDNTPLVVAFAGEPVTFAAGGAFAFQAGAPTATDWPTAQTPWIALDRNGNGAIDGGAELFGSDTPLGGGGRAVNGFAALAELDADGDGVIDARDPMFAALVLWADRDGDQRTSAGELAPLSSRVVSISLASSVAPRCDARSNCEGERAAITWRDDAGALHTGAVVDVYLPRR